MVEKIIFGNILWIYGTLDNHLPPHGSSIYDLDQVHEILLGLETANKLGVIWRSDNVLIKVRLKYNVLFNNNNITMSRCILNV